MSTPERHTAWVIRGVCLPVGSHPKYVSIDHKKPMVLWSDYNGLALSPSGLYRTKQAANAALTRAIMFNYPVLDEWTDFRIVKYKGSINGATFADDPTS